MTSRLLSFIKKEQLFSSKEPILLAVSGGVDSMAMAYLFKLAGLDFGIAHCNFQLRDAASIGDEALVRKIAQQWNIPFYTIRFDTVVEAKKEKTSIQIIARTLRYDWLENIRVTHNFAYIATAHHLNDSLETVLYNLAKGCGIRGLHGIPLKQGKIIRPLLFASRKEIVDFVEENDIPYREDASNASIKYKRNLIRHQIIPPLETINPALTTTFSKTMQHIKDAEYLFEESMERYKKQLVQENSEQITIQIAPLLNHPAKHTILYELLSPYGFNGDQVEQIFNSLTVGATFHSATHDLLVDRVLFIIKLKKEKKENFITVNKNNKKVIINNQQFTFTIFDKAAIALRQPSHIALLDYDTIQFPLTIRHWQQGDRFQPLGMKGKSKKLQDYFSDKKLSKFDKAAVLLLESEGQICWVVGHRLDERFKITTETKKILRVEVMS